MEYSVISFYQYTEIKEPEQLRGALREYCITNNLNGRVLIGNEGINGAVSGKNDDINSCKNYLQQIFPNLTFREQFSDTCAHHKLIVKVRKEICHFGKDVDLNNAGKHLSPKELKEWYTSQKDFVILDARNDYEYKVGKFKNALTLPIKNFRELPEAVDTIDNLKEKDIVMYCTGGVRCEKASAYLKEQGFKNVYQLDGGIINFVNQFPDTQWQGGLFVFDGRLVSDVGEPITYCKFCQKESEQYYNCRNLDCDKLFIACESCSKEMQETCSTECFNAPRKREVKIKMDVLGKVENYYAKNKIALVRLQEPISKDAKVALKGKTTQLFSQEITELRDEGGNVISEASAGDLVTFPVEEKIRKNDMVLAPHA